MWRLRPSIIHAIGQQRERQGALSAHYVSLVGNPIKPRGLRIFRISPAGSCKHPPERSVGDAVPLLSLHTNAWRGSEARPNAQAKRPSGEKKKMKRCEAFTKKKRPCPNNASVLFNDQWLCHVHNPSLRYRQNVNRQRMVKERSQSLEQSGRAEERQRHADFTDATSRREAC